MLWWEAGEWTGHKHWPYSTQGSWKGEASLCFSPPSLSPVLSLHHSLSLSESSPILTSSALIPLLSLHLLRPSRSLSHSLSLCQLINGHSKSVWFADQSPLLFFFFPTLSLLLPSHSPALHRSIPPAAIMRGILSFVPAPMVHLASDMGTTGTGNRREFLRGGGGFGGLDCRSVGGR